MSEQQPPKPGEIHARMARVLKAVSAVGKEGHNTEQKYFFRSVDDLYNNLHPLLAAEELYLVPLVEESRENLTERTGKAPIVRCVLRVRFRFYAPDGSFVDAVTQGEGVDYGDKATYKAESGAFKYAVALTFCIPFEDAHDPDKSNPGRGDPDDGPGGFRPPAGGEPPPAAAAPRGTPTWWKPGASFPYVRDAVTKEGEPAQVEARIHFLPNEKPTLGPKNPAGLFDASNNDSWRGRTWGELFRWSFEHAKKKALEEPEGEGLHKFNDPFLFILSQPGGPCYLRTKGDRKEVVVTKNGEQAAALFHVVTEAVRKLVAEKEAEQRQKDGGLPFGSAGGPPLDDIPF